MKSFYKWFAAQQAQIAPLPDGVFEKDGKLMAKCCACDRSYELKHDIKEGFDPDMSYCGGSPRCLP